MHRTIIRLVKKDGLLVPHSSLDKVHLDLLTASVSDGALVEVYLEELGEFNHTLPQIAKFHAMCREIADEIGDSPDNVKLYVKRDAGLTHYDSAGEEQVKSFRDCTRTELANAITNAQRIAAFLGIPEHGASASSS